MPQATTPSALGELSPGSVPNNVGKGKQTELAIRAPPLPHITQGFVPLSMLIGRVVQHSYNRLTELVDSLQAPGQSDGEKKMRLMEHMQEIRKQFIKLLVLVMWAKNASQVSEVIDLKAYLDSQQNVFNNVVWNLFDVRRKMTFARIPNPDLKTAIQVLSTGKSTNFMTKAYVPPPPLAPKELLKTLRNINTLLSIRLALHEKLPPHFKNYRIQSGRATFIVENEFEVDLSIGDDDPASQLFLVDFRTTFEPSISSIPKKTFSEIAARGNTALQTKGLEGIYEFLHEFVVAYKIGILLRQAQDMLAGRWTENLHIKQIRRTLLIQYWSGKATGADARSRVDFRSWIEIGVMRGVAGGPSRLGVRWIREGRKVEDEEVPIDVAVLSTEAVVKTVIAMHTKYILTSLRDRLSQSLMFPPSSQILKTHPTDSFNSSLKIQLTPSRAVKILIEPITGRFALQKPTQWSTSTEIYLNSQPHKASEWIFRLKFVSMQDEIESRSRSMGWELLKMLNLRQQDMRSFFPLSTRYMSYMRRKSWNKNWIVTVVLGDTGQSCWVCEIHEAPSQYIMQSAHRIPILGQINVTYSFLDNLEKMAAGLITHYVNTRLLSERRIQYRQYPSQATSNAALKMPDLCIRFSSLIKANWSIDILKLTFQGLSTDGKTTVVVLGRTKEPMTQLGSTDISEADSDVSFHPSSGSYAIRFNVTVGDTVIDALVEKLQRIERLIRFVAVIRNLRLPCLHVSLGRIVFKYSASPLLTAEISFSGDQQMQLHLPPRSPHVRIRHLLETGLNSFDLETVIKSLTVTLPLLLAFDAIESRIPNEGDLYILARNVENFRLDYKKLGVVLDLSLKMKRSERVWFMRDVALRGGEAEKGVKGYEGRRVAEELKKVWTETGHEWEPLKIGAAVPIAGVGRLVEKVHGILMEGGGKAVG